jgi:hypothetical protein
VRQRSFSSSRRTEAEQARTPGRWTKNAWRGACVDGEGDEQPGLIEEGAAEDDEHGDAGRCHAGADDDRAVRLEPDEQAHESAGAAAHDGLAVPTSGAHREGQQEGGQEQRDGEHDVRRQ